jgi:hypothetical protein
MAISTKTSAKTTTKSTAKSPASAPLKPVPKAAPKAAPKPTTKSAVKALKPAIKKMPAKTVTAKVVVKPVLLTPIEKPLKPKKIKLVRDSFTIPKPEYLILDNLKLRATNLKHPIKKGELIRAGIKALAAMADPQLLEALKAVPLLKTGRPSK